MATSHSLEEKANQLANSERPSQLNSAENRPSSVEVAKDNDKSKWIVKFDDGDPTNPRNFKPLWKGFLAFQMSLLALAGAMGSSIMAPSQSMIAEDMQLAPETTSLIVALFVLGAWCPSPDME